MTVPPTITGLVFDKPAYTEGGVVELVVGFTPGRSDLVTSQVYAATDAAGQAGTLEVIFTAADGRSDPVAVAVHGGADWALGVLEEDGRAVFAAVAPGPGSYPVEVRVTDTATGLAATGTATLTVAGTGPGLMGFGGNQNHVADMERYVGPITIQRSYKSLANGWPAIACACHWSIYPKHAELMSGSLDAAIIAALRNAPPGSLLTPWHEPELHSGRATGPTMAELADELYYLQDLAHRTTPNVLVGPVITAHADKGWCPPGLDFYGVDTYDWQGYASQPKELDDWSARMPDGPRVVAETNTMKPEKRPAWFMGVYQWLAANGGLAMCTFWSTGSLSGLFLPDDAATIDTLNQIAAAAAGNQ